MQHLELSVVVLCYKSGPELIPYTDAIIQEINSLNIPFELVLVCNYDKGDRENNITFQVASELKRTKSANIQIIFKEKEGGMGWDLKTGIHACKGRYICFLDGDGQTHPKDITILYHAIMTENTCLTKTYRNTRHDGWFRKIQSTVFNTLFNLMYTNGYQRIKDVNAKPKMALRSTFQALDLQSNDWYIDAEIILKLVKDAQKITEIPTIFYANIHRKSFVKWSTILEFLKNMFLRKGS